MITIADRLARCDRAIALAVEQRSQPHTEAEHSVILRCEIDWQIERKRVVAEMVMQAAA